MSDDMIITGRSSSHFTRVARIFAAELKLDYTFTIVHDLTSLDVANYCGNPALKIPVLQNRRGRWFGALPICRELQRQSSHMLRILWPENLVDNVPSNAQELVLQCMSTEVNLIMSKLSGDTPAAQLKMTSSLHNMMSWLDANVSQALSPQCDLSFLEVTLFCLVEHLEFRQLLDVSGYRQLAAFRRQFARRDSAVATSFKFD